MGTRVDFYAGRGNDAEWLGSYPFDGYPDGVFADTALWIDPGTGEPRQGGIPEVAWRQWVTGYLAEGGERSTLPEHGWPWPWPTSATTDYAYAWDGGVVYGSTFGRPWFVVDPGAESWGEPDFDGETEERVAFPDMSDRKALTYGPRSGLIVVTFGESGAVSS